MNHTLMNKTEERQIQGRTEIEVREKKPRREETTESEKILVEN